MSISELFSISYPSWCGEILQLAHRFVPTSSNPLKSAVAFSPTRGERNTYRSF